MAFTTSIFTNAGLGVLSRATATARVVIVDVIACEEAVSEGGIKTKPKAYFEERESTHVSASVVSVGTDVNSSENSRIVIALKLQDSVADVTVKTILVTARVVSQGSSVLPEVTFFGCTDADGIVIPYNADTPVSVNVAMSFAFNRASSIEVAGNISNYLLADEVGRFVTSHSIGDQDAGDDQTIYGTKTFMSPVVVDTDDAMEAIIVRYAGDHRLNIAPNDYGADFLALNTTVDDENVAFSFMDIDNNVYCDIGGDSDGAYVATDNLRADKAHVDAIKARSMSAISLYNNLLPGPNQSLLTIGGPSSKFAGMYAQMVNANNVNAVNTVSTYVQATTITKGDNDDMVASINELCPTPLSGGQVGTGIGNIMLMVIDNAPSGGIVAGQVMTLGTGGYAAHPVMLSVSGSSVTVGSNNNVAIVGKWRLLTTTGSGAVIALAIKVENA